VRKRTLTRQRTARACLACVEAKLRCNDTRPCERCAFKGITCQAAKPRHSINIQDDFRPATQHDEPPPLDQIVPPETPFAVRHSQEYVLLPSENEGTLTMQNTGPMQSAPPGAIEDPSAAMLISYDAGVDSLIMLPPIVDNLQNRMPVMTLSISMSTNLTTLTTLPWEVSFEISWILPHLMTC